MTESEVFGCDYCRDDQNRFYGHVTQVGSNDERKTLLLCCPRCGSLYENSARGPDQSRPLAAAEAERLFPGAHLHRPNPTDPWGEVRRLWNEKIAAPFPDCRGDEIAGVDLVMADSDLAGCVMHFLGNRFGTDEFQLRVLKRVSEDLRRTVPQMSGDVERYFERELQLAVATLAAQGHCIENSDGTKTEWL